MPFVSRPQRNPVAPPRATKNPNSATFDPTSKLQAKLNSANSGELEHPAKPVPQQQAPTVVPVRQHQQPVPQENGAMIQTAPQMNRFDDPMNGFGYGYGFGGFTQGWGTNSNSFGFGGMGFGGHYAAGMNAFAPDVVAPSAYYDNSNDATFFANGTQQSYNNLYGGFYGPQQPTTVYSNQQYNNQQYSNQQQGIDYQSLYGMTPDYYGSSTQYFNAVQSQQNSNSGSTLSRQASSLYPGEMEPRAASTIFATQSSLDSESLFGGLRGRSQSQPILRRSSSPLAMGTSSELMMPVQPAIAPSLAPWEEVFLQHQNFDTPSVVAPTVASSARTMSSIPASTVNSYANSQTNSYVTPWGTTMQTPRAQTPPPAMMAQMWSSGSTTSWSNESVSKMVRTEVVKFGHNLATKVKTELHDAFVLHPTRAPMMPKTWDSSRPRVYEYRPCERTIEENGVPVCSVQYMEDGTAFNLVVNGERLGAVMRNPTTTLRNPFKNVGPRRGDDWLVVDRNRQTRYRIQRRPKNHYELVVLLGAQTALSVHSYSCNWYNAITTGVLSVTDPSGQVVGQCRIGEDTTGSQMDRRMDMSCAQGVDHPTVLSTMLLALELARVYSNEAIHPSNQSNRGKATMGFGPSVTPNLFFM